MNIRDNPALREKLAAEYALGTLRGGARRRFETWLRGDAALRATVAAWQGRLAPLAELGRSVPAPARAWDGIERRLGFAAGPAQDARTAPWWRFWELDGARPWPGIALGAVAAALVLAVLLVARTPGTLDAGLPQQVAALSDAQAHTALVVSADARRQRLEVRVARDLRVPDDRTLQLWAIDRAGKPHSLGILADNRHAELALDARATGPDVALLAISLEPKGGSPDPNGPTGPVLYKGAWTTL
ncbi:anti-sigma factor domain-containing protein [Massilia sp. 9096]|uniref:anti-sigma factor n=1 Tax=Massilia sp. 9096 TaxID=1500894 RepID=UPI00056626C5|nr:anti-sigma factor [Massilia sp. 9096]